MASFHLTKAKCNIFRFEAFENSLVVEIIKPYILEVADIVELL